MEGGFSAETFAATLALVGVVIMVAALLSGLIERSGLPQVAVLLGMGAAIGPAGLGLLNVTLESPILRVVTTLSLMLVLFTDALTINIGELRRNLKLTLLVLGPGTLLSAALVALLGWGMLGLAPAAAAILGAALASTDPVLLRGLLRRSDVPPSARLALRLESGLNDVVLLPVVVVAIALFQPGGERDAGYWSRLALDLLILGPGAGVIVGLLAVATLDLVRRRIGVRRDYESLYSLGVALAAFAAAEAVHGSGFLAAFAAGMTIAAVDVELCDCFLEYGETTAEMALLFTFVLFGSSLIWSGFTVLNGLTLLFVLLVLLARPLVYLAALLPAHIDRRSRVLIAWFGPRGLSSLLLVLLPVFAGLPGSEELFTLCCLVVVFSVAIFGVAPTLFDRHTATAAAPPPVMPEANGDGSVPIALVPVVRRAPPAEPAQASAHKTSDAELLTISELRGLLARQEPVHIIDARTERTLRRSLLQAKGAVRIDPNEVLERARALQLSPEAWLVVYCA